MTDLTSKKRKCNLKTLRPYKHKQLEFFIADDVDICTFRDEIASMEHPFFALKAGDTRDREYKNRNVTVTVKPNSDGLATVFDKDIWIYSISKLQEAINNNQPISRTIAFTPYDFFVTTNRDKSGRAYEDLRKALARLAGTRIETNIIYSDSSKKTENFGLIDKWVILEEKKGNLNIGMVEVVLPNWLFEALEKKQILKISVDYFRIRKAIDRRIYEIARKHCGNQPEFAISLEKLHLKTGSTSLLKMFRYNVKQLAKSNDLPDYEVLFNVLNDKVTFKNRNQDDFQVKISHMRENGKKEIYKIKNKVLNK